MGETITKTVTYACDVDGCAETAEGTKPNAWQEVLSRKQVTAPDIDGNEVTTWEVCPTKFRCTTHRLTDMDL